MTVNQITLRPNGFLKKDSIFKCKHAVDCCYATRRGITNKICGKLICQSSIQKWMLSAYNTTKRSSIMFPNDYSYFGYWLVALIQLLNYFKTLFLPRKSRRLNYRSLVPFAMVSELRMKKYALECDNLSKFMVEWFFGRSLAWRGYAYMTHST